MDILNVIKNRRSVREFQAKPISEEIIDKLIEALIWAPSAPSRVSKKEAVEFVK